MAAKAFVVVNPDAETVARYRDQARREAAAEAALLHNRDLPAETLDGHRLAVSANIDHIDEIQGALDHGAEGIGLFRTEYMFMDGDLLPSEEDHYQHAKRVLELMGERQCTFRTFDLGADKLARFLTENHAEANPALACVRFACA